MRIKLIGGKYDGKTFIVPDDTVQYRPEGTKEIAYENQAYRIGFDVVFKLIEVERKRGMSSNDTKFNREYLHEQLWQLRVSRSVRKSFGINRVPLRYPVKLFGFVFWQTESRTAFDQIRTEATLSELRTRWRLIQTLRNPYQVCGESC